MLDAAERLFADRGYESTSLTEVGAAAGVSRGTPGYFFGSKEQLYRAVLERCLERVRVAVRSGRERALASQESPDVVLAGAVGEYFDFISDNPHFVRLLEAGEPIQTTPVEGRWCEVDSDDDLRIYSGRLDERMPWRHDWRWEEEAA